MGPLFGKRFSMTKLVIEKLRRQLTLYFGFTGIMNNDTYPFMKDYQEWLLSHGINGNPSLNMIAIPVTWLLAKLLFYTVLALE